MSAALPEPRDSTWQGVANPDNRCTSPQRINETARVHQRIDYDDQWVLVDFGSHVTIIAVTPDPPDAGEGTPLHDDSPMEMLVLLLVYC
uniref:hypothetical protein n=1 Tax=Protofrankia symbiont of Coriaria ruscifolia TaxID=1306542 RepID=UPI001A93E78F